MRGFLLVLLLVGALAWYLFSPSAIVNEKIEHAKQQILSVTNQAKQNISQTQLVEKVNLYKKELQKLNDKIAFLNEKIDNLTQQNSALKQENKKLKEELNKLKHRYERTKKELFE